MNTAPASKKLMPDNWRIVLSLFNEPPSHRELSACFGVSPTVVYRWRKEFADFGEECEKIIRKPKEKKPQQMIIANMSPDDIDLLLYDLLYERPSVVTLKQARIAIRTLRKEKREALSVANRLRHAAHMRNCGRGLPTHANGGGSHETL